MKGKRGAHQRAQPALLVFLQIFPGVILGILTLEGSRLFTQLIRTATMGLRLERCRLKSHDGKGNGGGGGRGEMGAVDEGRGASCAPLVVIFVV